MPRSSWPRIRSGVGRNAGFLVLPGSCTEATGSGVLPPSGRGSRRAAENTPSVGLCRVWHGRAGQSPGSTGTERYRCRRLTASGELGKGITDEGDSITVSLTGLPSASSAGRLRYAGRICSFLPFSWSVAGTDGEVRSTGGSVVGTMKAPDHQPGWCRPRLSILAWAAAGRLVCRRTAHCRPEGQTIGWLFLFFRLTAEHGHRDL